MISPDLIPEKLMDVVGVLGLPNLEVDRLVQQRDLVKGTIEEQVAARGFLPIDALMTIMTMGEKGYHTSGTIENDFRTPQMFFPPIGEAYGNYLYGLYLRAGRPANFVIFEPGGGNGEMPQGIMEQARRLDAQFANSIFYRFFEINESRREVSKARMSGYGGQFVAETGSIFEADFGKADFAVLMATEFDDILPTKAIYKINPGRHFANEIGLAPTESGGVQEVGVPAAEKVEAFTFDNPAWWSKFPVDAAIPFPSQSIELRERFCAEVGRGAIVTTDYGYTAETRYAYDPSTQPPFFLYLQQHFVNLGEKYFANMLDFAGVADVSCVVDFWALGQPARQRDWQTQEVKLNSFLASQNVGEVIERHLPANAQARAEYLNDVEMVTGSVGKNWTVQLQEFGLER